MDDPPRAASDREGVRTDGMPRQIGAIGPSLAVVKDWKLEEFIATLRNRR